MTTFAEYATSEYLHYWLADAPNLHLNFAQSKADIMQRHMSTMSKRIQSEAEIASLAGVNPTLTEMYLSGDLFDRVVSEAENGNKLEEVREEHSGEINSFADIGKEAGALVESGTAGLNDLDNFISLLQDWFNTLNDEQQAIADEYSAWLKEQIFSNKLGKSKYTASYGEGKAAQKIIASILANTHDSVFTTAANKAYKGRFTALNTTEKKMVAVLNYALKASEGDINYTVNHHDKTVGQEKASSKAELTAALAEKVKKGIQAQHRSAREVADGLCRLQAASEGLSQLSKLNSEWKPAGNDYVQIKFTPDVQQKQIYASIEASKRNAISIATGKQKSKADTNRKATIGEGGGSFETTWGISSKTSYWSWKKDIQTVDIKVQDGTPLLTLLMREAKFSGVQMYDIFQLAGGVGGKKPMGDLEAQWNELMNLAKYEAVLDCIAGIPTENAANGQVYWVNINDAFFTVSDILENIRDYGDVSLLYSSSNEKSNKGLERQSYVNINEFEPQDGKSREEAAWIRSNRAMKEIPNLMYQTKIRVNISLKEMIAFSKTHGFLKS